jgi:general secretion pathway protein F
MAAYQYQALKKSGQTSKGIIEADSERHARQLLREGGLFPTHVQLIKKVKHVSNKNKISSQNLALFTRQLAILLAAGIPIEEALRGVIEQTEKEKIRQLIMGVRSKVLEGYSLAQALAEFPYAFQELYVATVMAGEQTGKLDVVLEKLADYTERQQQTKQKIQQALIYPSLMILVSVGIISFLLTFVVPKIIDVFSSSGQSLPSMTKILIGISTLIKADGFYILAAFVVALFLFKRSLRLPAVRKKWHTFLLKVPIVGYLIRSINVSRYIHTFSILFAAGVSVLETMRVASSLLNNEPMHIAFRMANERVREGAAISQTLKDTGFISPMALHLIASGEKSGQLAPMMERAAAHMDNEVKRIIDTMLILLEPLVIILMGGVVLFIVLSTLLPIFSMEQLVN